MCIRQFNVQRRAAGALASLLAIALTPTVSAQNLFVSSGTHHINEGDVYNAVLAEFNGTIIMHGGLVTLDATATQGGRFILEGGVVQGFGLASGTFFGGGLFTILGGNIGGRFTASESGDVLIEAESFWYAADDDDIPNDPIEIPAGGDLVIDSSSDLFFLIPGSGFAIPKLTWVFEGGGGDTLDFHRFNWTGTLVLRRVGGPQLPPEDLTGDGGVDGADLANLLAQWGTDGAADFNGDGVVNGADLAQLLASWSPIE